tara:strand:- start:72 stop:761 length:690 start_codon:yes stop_codon:yes gene_type:complete
MSLSNFTKNYGISGPPAYPNANKRYFNHNSGSAQSDKVLLVVATMANVYNNPNFTTATYGGVTMTRDIRKYFNGLQQRQVVYSLVNPSDGTNQLVLNISQPQYNGVSIACYTFIGCAGVGNSGVSGGVSTPNTKSLTCSANSIIMLTGISIQSQNGSPYRIGTQSSITQLFYHNVNDQVSGVLSSNVSVGSVTCQTKVTSGNITNIRVEMLEASAPPSGNSGNFLMMFN